MAKAKGSKKSGTKKGRKHRTAAQKAATKKMLAANRARLGKGTHHKGKGRRHSDARKARGSREEGVHYVTKNEFNSFRTRTEDFQRRQHKWNSVVAKRLVSISSHIGLRGPTSERKLLASHHK